MPLNDWICCLWQFEFKNVCCKLFSFNFGNEANSFEPLCWFSFKSKYNFRVNFTYFFFLLMTATTTMLKLFKRQKSILSTTKRKWISFSKHIVYVIFGHCHHRRRHIYYTFFFSSSFDENWIELNKWFFSSFFFLSILWIMSCRENGIQEDDLFCGESMFKCRIFSGFFNHLIILYSSQEMWHLKLNQCPW